MGKRRAHLLCVLLLATGGGCIHVAPEPLSAERSATALETRNLAAPELRDFIAAQSGARPEAWPLPSWNLEDLTLAALFFAPDLREARAGADVATAGVRTAGQLPNPTLSVLPQGVSNAIAGASPWIAVVQIDWTIETAGKRGHRRAAAQARADAAALALPSAVWSLRGRLVEAVVRSQAARSRHARAQRSLALQERLVELLEQRLRAGATDQNTLVPQRIALIGMRADAARSEGRALESRAALAAVLALPVEALEGVEIDFALDHSPLDVDALESRDARRAALLGRADLLALLAEYAASEADLKLELARQVPDLHLGPGYEFDQGSNKWGLALSLDIPLLNQNQGGIGEAVARRGEVAARFDALQTAVIAEVDSAAISLRSAQLELTQAERLVDSARERRRMLGDAFDAGSADRFALLGADLEAERAASSLIDAQERRLLAVAALERAIQPDRAFAPVAVVARSALEGEGEVR